MKVIIEVKKLSVHYGKTHVLKDISLVIEKGDFVALAGPNGAGKTTLIKAIMGLIGKSGGDIKMFGKDFKSFSDWNKIGYLPQRVNAFNPLFPATVKEVIGLGLLSKKSYPKRFNKKDEEKIKEMVLLMDLIDIQNKAVSELSGGQQQRVFLARALVSDPELLILDEPSTALDPKSRQHFFELVKKLNKKKGITIILITHDTPQAGIYANKLLYLDKKVIFYGSFSEFCQSQNMEKHFGHFSQHIICHQHD